MVHSTFPVAARPQIPSLPVAACRTPRRGALFLAGPIKSLARPWVAPLSPGQPS
nr:hypothetical protein [uncultured Anaerovibrio sp.]